MFIFILAVVLSEVPWNQRHLAAQCGWTVPRCLGQENTAGFRPHPRRGEYRGKR